MKNIIIFISIIIISYISHYIYNNQIINNIPITSETDKYIKYNFNTYNSNKVMNGARAILIGGTGATGKPLIKELINSPHFSEITSLVRTIDPNVQSDKLKQVVVDFEKLENYKSEFEGKDVAFNVFGTTRKQAGSAERFVEIDYGYAAKFSELSKEAGVRSMHLLTSTGSNPNSWFLYPKTKGRLEEKMKSDNFHFLSIFRPGFLERGKGDRWIENIASKLLSGLPVETLAKAMRIEAEKEILNPSDKNQVKLFANKDIYKLVEDENKSNN